MDYQDNNPTIVPKKYPNSQTSKLPLPIVHTTN